MPFMVIFSKSDGTSCYEQSDAIDEAALFVERLRNQDGIQEIRIFRMEEISFAFRPYYKVELGMPERLGTSAPPAEVFGTAPAPRAPEDDVELQLPPDLGPAGARDEAVEPATPTGEDPDEDANSRRGLFGR
jgi:hypothetical protein